MAKSPATQGSVAVIEVLHMYYNIIKSSELGKKFCRIERDGSRYYSVHGDGKPHSQNLIRGFSSAYKRNASKGAGVQTTQESEWKGGLNQGI